VVQKAPAERYVEDSGLDLELEKEQGPWKACSIFPYSSSKEYLFEFDKLNSKATAPVAARLLVPKRHPSLELFWNNSWDVTYERPSGFFSSFNEGKIEWALQHQAQALRIELHKIDYIVWEDDTLRFWQTGDDDASYEFRGGAYFDDEVIKEDANSLVAFLKHIENNGDSREDGDDTWREGDKGKSEHQKHKGLPKEFARMAVLKALYPSLVGVTLEDLRKNVGEETWLALFRASVFRPGPEPPLFQGGESLDWDTPADVANFQKKRKAGLSMTVKIFEKLRCHPDFTDCGKKEEGTWVLARKTRCPDLDNIRSRVAKLEQEQKEQEQEQEQKEQEQDKELDEDDDDDGSKDQPEEGQPSSPATTPKPPPSPEPKAAEKEVDDDDDVFDQASRTLVHNRPSQDQSEEGQPSSPATTPKPPPSPEPKAAEKEVDDDDDVFDQASRTLVHNRPSQDQSEEGQPSSPATTPKPPPAPEPKAAEKEVDDSSEPDDVFDQASSTLVHNRPSKPSKQRPPEQSEEGQPSSPAIPPALVPPEPSPAEEEVFSTSEKFEARRTKLAGGTEHVHLFWRSGDRKGPPLKWQDVISFWEHDQNFADFFSDTLNLTAPHSKNGFYWECPPIRQDLVAESAFGYRAVPADESFKPPDSTSMKFLKDCRGSEKVAAYPNKEHTAVLVSPCQSEKADVEETYGHIASFVRKASRQQQQNFWATLAVSIDTMLQELKHSEERYLPVWVGCGAANTIPWLTARVSTQPDYIQTEEYKSIGS